MTKRNRNSSSDDDDLNHKTKFAAVEDSEEDHEESGASEDDDDSSEVEESAPSKLIRKASLKRKAESDDSDDDDDDEEEEDEEDEEPQAPVRQEKVEAKRRKVESSSKNVEPTPKSEPKLHEQDTPPVTDPALREEISLKIKNRLHSSLLLFRLPTQWNLNDVMKLHKDAITCRLPWNTITRKNKGRAVLEFASKEAAAQAKESIPVQTAKGKLTVHFPKEVDINVDEYNCRRLIVFNLPWNYTEEKLQSLFPSANKVHIPLSVQKRSVDKRQSWMAYILFDSERDAISAYDTMHGHKFQDDSTRTMSIDFHRRNESSVGRQENNKELVLVGVKKLVSDADLRGFFPQVKTITRNLVTGCVFLSYLENADAQLDYKNALPKIIEDRRWRLYFGRPRFVKEETSSQGGNKQNNHLFIKNIQKYATLAELKSLFPTSTEIRFPMKNNNQCVGFAVISFPNKSEAERMLKLRAGSCLRDKEMNITFAEKEKLDELEKKQAKMNKAENPKAAIAEKSQKIEKSNGSPSKKNVKFEGKKSSPKKAGERGKKPFDKKFKSKDRGSFAKKRGGKRT